MLVRFSSYKLKTFWAHCKCAPHRPLRFSYYPLLLSQFTLWPHDRTGASLRQRNLNPSDGVVLLPANVLQYDHKAHKSCFLFCMSTQSPYVTIGQPTIVIIPEYKVSYLFFFCLVNKITTEGTRWAAWTFGWRFEKINWGSYSYDVVLLSRALACWFQHISALRILGCKVWDQAWGVRLKWIQRRWPCTQGVE
jgi:hypothetical protein